MHVNSPSGGCGACPPQALSQPQCRTTYRFSFNLSDIPKEVNLEIRGGDRKGKWGLGVTHRSLKLDGWKVGKVMNTKSSSLLLRSGT